MRLVLTLCVGIVLAAWADAQQAGSTLTAAERLKQLQSNRTLVGQLVQHGVTLANANEPLKRAEECRRAMGDLSIALNGAIDAQDPNRVAELGDHLTAIVDRGLIPNLKDALPDATPGSPTYEQFQTLHKSSSDEMQRLQNSVPQLDALGRSSQVKAMLANWSKTREELANIR